VSLRLKKLAKICEDLQRDGFTGTMAGRGCFEWHIKSRHLADSILRSNDMKHDQTAALE
jgi:hypothetical protein